MPESYHSRLNAGFEDMGMDKQYGLIFDLDGVIADTESVNVRATAKAFEDLFGLTDVNPEDFEAGLGRGAEEYVKAGARAHGLELTDEQAKEAAKLRQENFLKILAAEPLPPYPGVIDLIDSALASENFQVGIATSGTLEKSRAALEAAGIPYEKMVYVNGGDVKNKKPDPELFLTAAKRMALTPERCVVIEDAPNGVEAAKAAGTKCVAVTNTTSADKLAQAEIIVESLDDIDLNGIIGLIDGG